MNALCISGGATKIVGEFGVAEQIFSKFRPEYIAGVSAGAILALALPTIDWEKECNCKSSKLKNTLLKMKSKDLWTVNPTNSKGGLSIKAVIRAISGYSSFGDMSKTGNFIKSVITEKLFYDNIVNSNNYKGIFVGSICYNTGHRAYIDLKKCKYEEAISWVLASSSIPVYTEPYKYNDYYYFDGGVRNHSPGPWMLENHGKEITNMVSIFSRPQDFNVIDQKWEPSNVYKVLERTIEIMQIELSKSDEQKEVFLSKEFGVNLEQLFLPKVLKGLYDTDVRRLWTLYMEGLRIGKEYNERTNK